MLDFILEKYNRGERPIKVTKQQFEAYWDYLAWDKFNKEITSLAYKDTYVVQQ
jgi:hypothetical protein